jgi:hypothetical protein
MIVSRGSGAAPFSKHKHYRNAPKFARWHYSGVEQATELGGATFTCPRKELKDTCKKVAVAKKKLKKEPLALSREHRQRARVVGSLRSSVGQSSSERQTLRLETL